MRSMVRRWMESLLKIVQSRRIVHTRLPRPAENFWRAPYFVTYQLPVVIVRASNNFGPYQYPEKLMPLFITNAMENKPLPLYGDGKNVRDWLYVEDHCRAIELVLRQGRVGRFITLAAE